MSEEATTEDRLPRNLGLWSAAAVLVGTTIGSGIFRVPSEVARDELMQAEAWQFICSHPLDDFAILPGKLAGMYLLETQAVTSLFQGEHHASDSTRHFLYGLSQLAWLTVAALVIVRMASFFRSNARPRGANWVGWWLVAYFTAICLVFHGEDRYRLPLLPWFLIEAAAALAFNRATGRSAR